MERAIQNKQLFVMMALLIAWGAMGFSPLVAHASKQPATASPSRDNLTVASNCPSPQTAYWTSVSSPNSNTSSNTLHGVAAISLNDVWAVGYYDDPARGVRHTLTEHWNGTAWSIVPSANTALGDIDLLESVAAVASDDVWAVGFYGPGGVTSYQTLTEHWDGAHWSIVTSPNITGTNRLLSVTASAHNDVWAVGYSEFSSNQTITEHWDGTQWSIVASPSVSSSANQLNGVVAVSASDVWAVGSEIEHWDGMQWQVVSSPTIAGSTVSLNGVSAVSSTDVWAVGTVSGSGTHSALEHWNGTNWSMVTSPANELANGILASVAAVNARSVWAVGSSGSPPTQKSLVEYWDGTQWSVSTSGSLNTISQNNELWSVAALSSTSPWAAGDVATSTGISQTLIARGLSFQMGILVAPHSSQRPKPSIVCHV